MRLVDISNTKLSFKAEGTEHISQNGPIPKQIKTSVNLKNFDNLLNNTSGNTSNIDDDKNKPREDVLVNFIYSVCDFFNSKKYNMERLRPLNFSDLKQTVMDAQSQGVYKQLPREQKKRYLANLLEVKNKQLEIKNQRINDLKKEGKQIYLIKISNKCIGIPKFDFYIPYNDLDIYIVKQCLLNNWLLPPPSYYSERFPMTNSEYENYDTISIYKF